MWAATTAARTAAAAVGGPVAPLRALPRATAAAERSSSVMAMRLRPWNAQRTLAAAATTTPTPATPRRSGQGTNQPQERRRPTGEAAAAALGQKSTSKLRSMLAERGLLTTGTRAELIERLRQAAPAARAPAAAATAAAQEPGAEPELPEITEGPEREVIRAIERCTSASEVGAQLGRVVTTWAGAPSSRILVAALRKADELNALPLAYAIVYQVRLYGTSQYAKRLTPAVYEQLVRSAMRLSGDRDVLVIAQRMMQDAIMPTVPTFAMLFQVLLRCGDRRQLWAWYSEYRARPRPAGTADSEAVVPESLEVAVRHYLRFRHPTKGGGPSGSGKQARKLAPRSAMSQ